MANVCDYFISTGGEDVIATWRVKALLAPALEHVPGGFYGDYVLRLDVLFPDLDEHEHSWIALNSARPSRGKVQIEDGIFSFGADGSLHMSGASKWEPPIAFVERLSRLFPGLTFEVGGTTEHEFYERWECREGVSKRIDAWMDHFTEGRRVVYARDGVEYDPPEVEEEGDE
jgi:hypothetical protein